MVEMQGPELASFDRLRRSVMQTDDAAKNLAASKLEDDLPAADFLILVREGR